MSKRVYKRDKIGRFAKTNTLGQKNKTETNLFHINIQLFAPVDYTKYKDKGLKSAIKSHNSHIHKHISYIQNPHIKYVNWDNMTEVEKKGAIDYWEKEIKNSNNQIQKIEEEISRRSNNEST